VRGELNFFVSNLYMCLKEPSQRPAILLEIKFVPKSIDEVFTLKTMVKTFDEEEMED